MSEKGALKKSTAQAICDAVKVKEGTTEGVPFKDVAERILALPTASGENKFAQLVDRTITEVTAEDLAGATTIGKFAFANCPNLIMVTIPDNITNIDENAIRDCSYLETLYLPDRVISFGSYCFQNDSRLKNVHIKSLSNWFKSSFRDANANPLGQGYMTKQFLYLYVNNERVIDLVIPNDITDIPKYAMSNYEKLKTIHIPSNVKSIGDYAFSKCKLSRVTIEEGLVTIGSNAFLINTVPATNVEFDNIILPNSLTTIGTYAFSRNPFLNVRIGNGITTIAINAFMLCDRLTDIYIDKPEGSIENAPWGATNATIHWNTPLPSEEV